MFSCVLLYVSAEKHSPRGRREGGGALKKEGSTGPERDGELNMLSCSHPSRTPEGKKE